MIRTFQIDLSDEAMKDIYTLTHSAGMTTDELLRTFITDLLSQDPTATSYFDCCTYPSDVSFSMWAIMAGAAEEAAELMQIIQDAAAEIAADRNYSSVLESVISDAGRDLAALYRSYYEATIHQGKPVQSYEAAIADMKNYIQGLKSILS